MLTGIVCVDPQAQTPSGVYLKPMTWKSLSQWWNLFHRVRLLMPAYHMSEPPAGWLRLPDTVESAELAPWDKPLNFLVRRLIVERNARRLLREVDLLYVRHPSYESYYVSAIAQRRRIPIISSLHGDWQEGVLNLKQGSLLRRLTRTYRAKMARRIYDDLVRYSLGVVTIGPDLAEKYVPKDKPLLVTSNYVVEGHEFAARTDFSLKNPPRFLFVGELQERKGLDYLLTALRELKSAGQDFRLIVVGKDRENGLYHRRVAELELSGQVEFLGVLPQGTRLREEYHRADTLVLPSICAEGLPRVVQEAMSQGCPVIATDVGSTRWQLQDGAGLLVPPKDSKAIQDALVQVLASVQLRQSLSERGFLRAQSRTFEKQRREIADFVRSTVPSQFLAPATEL